MNIATKIAPRAIHEDSFGQVVAGDPQVAKVRDMLQDQHDRLLDAFLRADRFQKQLVRHYLNKVRAAIAQPPGAMIGPYSIGGQFGRNGYGPAIDDICNTVNMSHAYDQMIKAAGKTDGSFEAAKAAFDTAKGLAA